jgi:hypothetical protein
MLRRDSLTLRRAKAEDPEFAFKVLKETMWEYVVATWGTWREEESQRETVEQVSAGRTEVIELNRVPIGVQLVDRARNTHSVGADVHREGVSAPGFRHTVGSATVCGGQGIEPADPIEGVGCESGQAALRETGVCRD